MRARVWGKLIVAAALAGAITGLAQGAQAAGCDEYNPASPARVTRIALGANDAVDDTRKELRTFVETGSLGKVDISYARIPARGPVQRVFAVPHVSRLSPLYGEELKGIEISAELSRPVRGSAIVVEVRQVCAQYFRNSFLYQ